MQREFQTNSPLGGAGHGEVKERGKDSEHVCPCKDIGKRFKRGKN